MDSFKARIQLVLFQKKNQPVLHLSIHIQHFELVIIQFAIVPSKYGNVQLLGPFGNGKNEPYENLKISRQVGADEEIQWQPIDE